MKLTHGGDLEGFKAQYGFLPIDFSVNTNPLGLPQAAKKAAIDALDHVGEYPDPLCRELTRALAKTESAPERFILCGNGAADLIFRLVYAKNPKTAMVTAPAFAEYELALRAADCQVKYHPLFSSNAFCVDESILDAITPGLDMLFLCEPGNPTGQLTEPVLLRKIMTQCQKTKTLLVVDECFNPFVDDPAKFSLVPYVQKNPGLFILKAFTKIYAMSGLRLGYCLSSDTALLNAMRQKSQPWAVSSLAQAAGVAALQDSEYLIKTKKSLREEKNYMLAELNSLGFQVFGHQANFIFFYTPIEDFHNLVSEKGFLLRDCSNYRGLEKGHYRMAIRGHEDNQKLIKALAELA